MKKGDEGRVRVRDLKMIFCLAEKAMATHSSTLAWKIPWMEEPGRLMVSLSSLLIPINSQSAAILSLSLIFHQKRKNHDQQ